ncbi:hypothetical protein PsYK624_031950 [Phanerochaete sordida]|uniref:Uncharacterized protein n=1 Tax=Phanerochaete sordida TaxID=48140 RepID=A0A9P3G164_9APHY|nr:hypothetical protein PsYK624_031950 [Phanerochaete sordida]
MPESNHIILSLSELRCGATLGARRAGGECPLCRGATIVLLTCSSAALSPSVLLVNATSGIAKSKLAEPATMMKIGVRANSDRRRSRRLQVFSVAHASYGCSQWVPRLTRPYLRRTYGSQSGQLSAVATMCTVGPTSYYAALARMQRTILRHQKPSVYSSDAPAKTDCRHDIWLSSPTSRLRDP